MRERKSDRLLAVVDLGSNSFRLEIGRVEGDQIYQLDTWRETLRFGAGVDDKGRLTRPAMKAALACLARFRERLSGLHPAAVRVVATNTFRVAKNAQEFVALAERTLGSRSTSSAATRRAGSRSSASRTSSRRRPVRAS
jgi:exopolyphosphatase/guanosine-5'-triphosphate,3'-diphosphate pyrophosphatase